MTNITLIDPACVPDTFCEGIGNISKVGDNLRIVIFATRESDGNDTEHLVVARLVWPRSTLASVIRQIEGAMKGLPFIDAIPANSEGPTPVGKPN
jgi:hypothetical protein